MRLLPRKNLGFAAAVLAALAALPAATPAADGPPDDARPLLQQLSRETEALYGDVRQGLLRVQLPSPRWLDGEGGVESPLTKYKELDPKVREALARGTDEPPTVTRSTTTAADVKVDADAALIVVPPPEAAPAAAAFAPNNIGLLLDDQGHVLVPLYVEPRTANQESIRVTGADGAVVQAKFVGSDRQTNLTVLQLPRPAGKPLRMSDDERPADGSLVMVVTPHDASATVALWTRGGREFAAVFTTDGRCAGVARFGQFLSGRACRLIAEQIIRHGSVRRATLGVIITVIRKDHPLRQQVQALGDRTAMRIDQVMPGSAADKAGLRPGDLLLALAGEPVADIPGFAAAIAARNGPTALQVLRGDNVVKIDVDLQQK